MQRILFVSNRLPVTVEQDGGRARVGWSAGGLATGLRQPHEQSGGMWLGWPGHLDALPGPEQQEVVRQLEGMRLVPMRLSTEEVHSFYDGFANGVLWPLFHYLLDRVPVTAHDWQAYREVNQRYANLVVEHHQPGDLIWVHDYQLMLVPGMLRAAIPDARIGFFLHIPFPAPDVFRILPWREEVLNGLLGSDLIGFHTAGYLRNFALSLLRVLGVEVEVDQVWHQGRRIRLGAFPMGVDASGLEAMAHQEKVVAQATALRNVDHLMLGVDRLDYTKGIPRRLLALERLFERSPRYRGKVRLVQIMVPSREKVPAYGDITRAVDEMVGRMNRQFGLPGWIPVQGLSRTFTQQELAAFYTAADIMLVTPLRDGLNLVAKEYVACRTNGRGVLVLSEFAGAADELGEALHVNPYDIDATAATLERALEMPLHEQERRMAALRVRVFEADIRAWARGYLVEMEELSREEGPKRAEPMEPEALAHHVWQRAGEGRVLLLLDYDGTLVPHAERPELAEPDMALRQHLRELCQHPRLDVHIISGRARDSLEDWLGDLPLGLHAEHRCWSRLSPGRPWVAAVPLDTAWRDRVGAILQRLTQRTPGSLVETKSASVAWHWRGVDPEYAAVRAKEIRLHLTQMLSNLPVQVLEGDKVVEVRLQSANKGTALHRIVQDAPPPALVVALGNDRTDEDMFLAAPDQAVTVHVGHGPSAARFNLPDPSAVRSMLQALLGRPSQPG